MKKEILIEGMSCGHCVQSVTDALNKLESVTAVEVNLEQKKATIEVKAGVEDAVISAVIEDIGFSVTGVQDQ